MLTLKSIHRKIKCSFNMIFIPLIVYSLIIDFLNNTNLNMLHYSEKVDLLLQLTNLWLQREWSELFLPWSLIAGQLTNGLKNKIHEHNNHVFWVVIFINFSHQKGAIMGWKHFKKSIWTYDFTKCFIQFSYWGAFRNYVDKRRG